MPIQPGRVLEPLLARPDGTVAGRSLSHRHGHAQAATLGKWGLAASIALHLVHFAGLPLLGGMAVHRHGAPGSGWLPLAAGLLTVAAGGLWLKGWAHNHVVYLYVRETAAQT